MQVWLVLSATIVSVLFGLNKDMKRLDMELDFEERTAKSVKREPRSTDSQSTQDEPLLKVLSFSDDIDNKADSNGEFTSATLEKANLPESFTICWAFMVDAWTTDFVSVDVFYILKDDGSRQWGYVHIYAAPTYTNYAVHLGNSEFAFRTFALFFPLQWTRVCLSLETPVGRATLVVDGQVLGEAEYETEEDKFRPANLSLLLGHSPVYEWVGKTTELNMFSSALPAEKMERMTRAGEGDCGAAGDFVSWQNTEWSLHSKAKIVEVNEKTEGPCRRESKLNVFTAEFKDHQDCMHHCQKIAGGRSPPVGSLDEWENFTSEIDLITPDRSKLPWMWLSATEGDRGNKLGKPPHWPESETVNNFTVKLDAEEGVWRNYYTGLRLQNWTKPYYSSKTDGSLGDTYNCIYAFTDEPWNSCWWEGQCITYDMSCPCQYPVQSLLTLRGLCEDSLIENKRVFTLKQLPGDPDDMLILGHYTTQIKYNKTGNHWKLTDAKSDVTAISQSSKVSYVLGKHNWTVSNDGCNKGQPYDAVLKLTGCKEEEFTCNDGQCVRMGRRCNQIPDCRDESDEKGCQLLILKDGYNKNIPPIKISSVGGSVPANVSISIVLMKVVDIDEVDNSVHLQFQISLKWRENRAKYQNLKRKTSLNALTQVDIERLWLPLVIYYNTDQKESTRLGWVDEWVTRVTVTREGNFTRTGLDKVDEAEIFEGAENDLTMTQTYTHEFQCQYRLQRYPFDTQVRLILTLYQMRFYRARNARSK